MSGNVAQAILGADWSRTLSDIHAALRPGGVLAFESRNPAARAWEDWGLESTLGTRETVDGRLTEWTEVTDVTEETVTFAAHIVFEATGEHLELVTTLAFRSQDRIDTDLRAAGFAVSAVSGGWAGETVGDGSRVLVVEARRPARGA